MGEIADKLREILKQNGFERVRHGKGDHEIWKHSATGKTATVDNGTKSRHTANNALKQAGLPKAF